jgi:hypothetical protein
MYRLCCRRGQISPQTSAFGRCYISRYSEDRVGQYLMVSSPAGVLVIRGPGVSAYHEKLAQGIADLVETNGKEITSVLYYPPAYGEGE